MSKGVHQNKVEPEFSLIVARIKHCFISSAYHWIDFESVLVRTNHRYYTRAGSRNA